jgi:hypothetical protein
MQGSESDRLGGCRMESDVSYFRRRASDERSAAMQARLVQARQAHLELAERYEDLVRAITGTDQQLGIGTADDPLRRGVDQTPRA